MTEYAYTITAQAYNRFKGASESVHLIELVADHDDEALLEALRVLGPLDNPYWRWHMKITNRVDIRILAARGKEPNNA